MENDLQERQGMIERAPVGAGNLRCQSIVIAFGVGRVRIGIDCHLIHGSQTVIRERSGKGTIDNNISHPGDMLRVAMTTVSQTVLFL